MIPPFPVNAIPRVSIIVATYNAARELATCLSSIREQSFHNWELLIIDAGSINGTVDIIQRNIDVIGYWHSQPDNGIYDAWNQALSHASGEYVAFLGADDAWHAPDSLEKMFDAIGDRQFNFVSGRWHLVDQDGGLLQEFGHSWDSN